MNEEEIMKIEEELLEEMDMDGDKIEMAHEMLTRDFNSAGIKMSYQTLKAFEMGVKIAMPKIDKVSLEYKSVVALILAVVRKFIKTYGETEKIIKK